MDVKLVGELRENQLLQGELHILELIVTRNELPEVLVALCRTLDEQSGLMSSIHLFERTSGYLSMIAGPNLPDAWKRAIQSFRSMPTAGSWGAAVHGRARVTAVDLLKHPLFLKWRDSIRESRIGAVCSTPFFAADGTVLGTLAVADFQSRMPSDEQLALAARAAYLAGIAVERRRDDESLRHDIADLRRVEAQLRTSEHLLAEAQRLAHIGSWHWDLTNGTVTWSDELYRIFGLEPREIDPVREAMDFIHADDRVIIERAIANTFQTRAPYNFSYRIRRRNGDERSLHSRGHVVYNEHGESISVFGTTQDFTDRKHAEEKFRQSEQLLRLVLDAIPVGVAVMDPAGDVILSNPASTRVWSGMITSGPERYARSKGWWHETGQRIQPDEWPSVRAWRSGETSINRLIDIETFDGTPKIIQNSAVPIRDSAHALVGAVVINEDISARKAAERELEDSASQMQTLATRLMHVQDDERRRIAQMLHETTAQDLAALKMLLARLGRTSAGLTDADRTLLADSVDLVERSMNGVRTLSYLLHPPFLDERGLLWAVRWYAEGFAARSGIAVALDLPPTFERLTQDVETTLFRVVQEGLINIHRHAQSPTASIRLSIDRQRLTLEIADRGAGMSAELLSRVLGGTSVGVGIAGMRERLKQLGGTLEIESLHGTTLRALVPLGDVAA